MAGERTGCCDPAREGRFSHAALPAASLLAAKGSCSAVNGSAGRRRSVLRVVSPERGLISTVRTCSTPPSVRAHLVRARVRVRVGVHLEARCLCSGVVRVRAKVGCVRAHRAAAPQPNLT